METNKCYKCKREVPVKDGKYIMDFGLRKQVWMCNRCYERMEIPDELTM